jgi:hypothetical protein
VSRWTAFGLALAVASSTGPAAADNAAGNSTPEASNPGPQSDARIATARKHFQRGVELSDDGDHDAALVEFSRAYELAPHWRILFNLGQVAYARRDWSAAIDFYRRYLDEGGDAVTVERRQATEGDIERLRTRIGTIMVVTDVERLQILVDDVVVARTPLATPLSVNVGARRVAVARAGTPLAIKVVDVAGGENHTVHFRLGQAPTLALRPEPPAATSRESAVTLSEKANDDQKRDMQEGDQDGSSRTRSWIAWSLTAGLGAAATFTGLTALERSRWLEEDRDTLGVEAEVLAQRDRDVTRWALATDGLMALTAIAATWALWTTFDKPARTTNARAARWRVHPGGVSMTGRF